MYNKIVVSIKNKYANLGLNEAIIQSLAKHIEKRVNEECQIETELLGVESILKNFQIEMDKLRSCKANAEQKVRELKEKKGNEAAIPLWAELLLKNQENLQKTIGSPNLSIKIFQK